MKKVLVFDSGVGGLSVLDAIVAAKLDVELDYVADSAWLPYGLRADAEIAARVPALLSAVARQWSPDLVVLACNTASTLALEGARAALTAPVVGVVPPIKPAAEKTRSGTIGLLATPATIRRAYTSDLIAKFAPDKRVIRVGSADLVAAAEQKLRGEAPDSKAISDACAALFEAPGGAAIDVVALACTHFPLLRTELQAAGPPQCTWLDSGDAIARRVEHVLIAARGEARLRRAGATKWDDALVGCMRARGFELLDAISPAPFFSALAL